MRKSSYSLARRALHARHASTVPVNPPVQVTTLPNRIRVATESTPGHFSSVGLYVDAGSRYENPSTSGVSHFIDRMAFKSTSSMTDAEMSTAINALGGQIMCSSSRETIMYQSSHFHQATPLAVSLIADTVLNASLLPEELDAQRDAAFYETREIRAKPEMILPEILHYVAYNNQALGNPLLCPDERIDEINAPLIRQFISEWYRPERMVIAGAGMEHEALVELADKYFSSLKYTPVETPSLSTSRQNAPAQQVPPHLLPSASSPALVKSLTRAASSYLNPFSPSQPPASPTSLLGSTYTGGEQFIHDPNSEFNHIYIAFEGVGIHDDDIYDLATMQVLLGGGGSFSAGGPGKGMYSRLYTHILNHHPQVDHCASFHHIYTDSSLFGLFASFVPSPGGRHGNSPTQLLPHLVHQLSLLLYRPVPSSELNRAKNQLKSSLVMALESRAVEVEDLGRQLLVHNRKVHVSEMCDKIDLVTAESLQRVATRVFGPESGGKPTIVTMGHEDVRDAKGVFKKYDVGSV
ncbi:mitochondrial processing peptidase [Stereum hirsutum FP-91666 SS1]|uniref:mitochondrial processing peptidase n=1 Tax=Stereum hirsutum (strain FP-91666) TaxID=721885 RepID=UPI0004449DBA|nr:mitochondrial processing peptidase [Stereum hirsutum FP-91666 SS1]EIM83585.1 mitochondrial processing peptidase [Stereum hirsutum FP-91666 SS1]